MERSSTIAELMERRRIQAGAKEYQGHTYMDLARFDEATKHMITVQASDGFSCAVSNKPFYPLNEASQLSGIPERDLYRMIQSHDLRGKKIGKSWYIRQEEMQDIMNQRKGT